VYIEAKRTNMLEYNLSRELFVDFGEISHSSIYEVPTVLISNKFLIDKNKVAEILAVLHRSECREEGIQ
jgi:hypothetical protein